MGGGHRVSFVCISFHICVLGDVSVGHGENKPQFVVHDDKSARGNSGAGYEPFADGSPTRGRGRPPAHVTLLGVKLADGESDFPPSGVEVAPVPSVAGKGGSAVTLSEPLKIDERKNDMRPVLA